MIDRHGNSTTWEPESGGSRVLAWPVLHSKSLLKKKREKKKNRRKKEQEEEEKKEEEEETVFKKKGLQLMELFWKA